MYVILQGMSVSKLRSKEESAIAAQKVQKKVDLQKPLTMAEALKERLARRNEYEIFFNVTLYLNNKLIIFIQGYKRESR